jgi:hypothetical protein
MIGAVESGAHPARAGPGERAALCDVRAEAGGPAGRALAPGERRHDRSRDEHHLRLAGTPREGRRERNDRLALPLGLLALILLLLLVCSASASACPTEQPAPESALLPDCRAWEMVSPLNKNGADIKGIEGLAGGGVVQASPDGEEITYVSPGSFGVPVGAPVGSQYLAARNAASGWESANISLPMDAQTYGLTGSGAPYDAFSTSLSLGLVFGGLRGVAGHPFEGPPLADAAAGYENYYLKESPGGSLRALVSAANKPAQPPGEFAFQYLGGTPDLTGVIVASSGVLAAGAIEAPPRLSLYEWERETGRFQTLDVLPDGTADPERELQLGGGGAGEATDHAVSSDGSRVVWTGAPPAGLPGSGLYLRENIGTNAVRTLQLDAAQGGEPESAHGGVFITADSDLSRIFFTDTNRLTGDPTSSSEGSGDLYMFQPGAPAGARLSDLTVDASGAGVQGVLGASEDGSYVYFAANGVLAAGATQGNCVSPGGPAGATCNLYVWHDGQTRFIATLASKDSSGEGTPAPGLAFDWDRRDALRTTRVSADGKRLLFMSERSLTGYDNTLSGGAGCGQGPTSSCQELFLYEADRGSLTCVSCNPGGARPVGPSGIPGATPYASTRAGYQSRVMSAGGGRIFFDSFDALVAQDTNQQEDVYEYENGHVYLLSGGSGPQGASFVDASGDGSDAFFITRAPLVPQDTDQLVDLYDARAPHTPPEPIGFAPPQAPAPCAGEACRASVAGPQPQPPSLSSATFTGPGNPTATAPSPAASHKPNKKKKRTRPRRRRRHARHASRRAYPHTAHSGTRR